MKKYLLISLLLFNACEQKEPKLEKPSITVIPAINKTDSLISEVASSIERNRESGKILDSSFYYFSKQVEARMKRDEYEIKYLKTGKEKYYRLGNKYVDSVHFWFVLLDKNAKKIK